MRPAPAKGARSLPIPPHLLETWALWRLIKAGMATLAEMNAVNGWSIDEVRQANDVLDLYDDLAALPPVDAR